MKKNIGYIEEEDRFDRGTQIQIYRTQVATDAAELAKQFVERWGMVAGQPDGEDSSGRAKLRLATPKEMVDRAIETAELLINTIEDKGWVLELPTPKPRKPRSEQKDT